MWRQIINLKMSKLDVSQTQLSSYSGVGLAKINTFCGGTRELGGADLEQLNATLSALEKIALIFHPVPVDFRKVPEVKTLLRNLVNHEYTEDIIRKALRTNAELSKIDTASLKSRYEKDIEFQREIDSMIHKSVVEAGVYS